MSTNISAALDPKVFRDVLGHYPTGVVVVTGRDEDGEILAMVVGTFSSVSLEPPLVSFMPMKTSRTFDKMRACSSLCINILGGEQEDVVLTIAQRWENKLDGIDWFESPSGDPVLSDSVAWIDTRLWDTVEAGDHWIALCEVRDLAVTNPVSPLIFFQGGYGSFVCTSLMARMDHEILPAIHAAHAARPQVAALASSIGCEVSVFTAVSSDEMATVLSATAPGVDREEGLAHRIPMVPPIGDSYVFDQDHDAQERWIAKLRGADDTVKEMHRARLAFVRDNGYLISFLPAEGNAAYDEMRAATRQYESGRLTPLQERSIRESIGSSPVDYHVRDLADDEIYDVGSLVLPIRDPNGGYSMTLRLGQLPARQSGARISEWIRQAGAVVEVLER
ncbi:flavin reductase family protein [Gordonia insulae]|uniref:Flavin-dependent monooxygenase, reductase subunit HsaB n=1 Tax=Gordonia insulae TaxID=2420509 RepID=A0A3G8JNI9_9ACTN|nr:flavin reductase family protein [Gordonia insulae]AZG46651.1 Flavin-dependent monooxygenase, reductase subunit HsaB [Gordonia insulae]